MREWLLERPARLSRSFWAAALVAWALALSGLAVSSSPKLPPSPAISFLWNFAHAPAYGLLAPLLLFSLPRREGLPPLDRFSLALGLGLVLAVGASNEALQSLTIDRGPSLWDLLAAAAGGIAWAALLVQCGSRAPSPVRFAGLSAFLLLLCAIPAWVETFLV